MSAELEHIWSRVQQELALSVDELTYRIWLAPLRPGDDLMLDVEIVEARVSRSRPGTGIVTVRNTSRNANGQALCEMVSPLMVARRAGAAAEQGG